ncbi:transient receptor potential cation channel subfamily V member 6 [Ditylenchus destructor]|uniref:Transient receptor potential cation channel subfamily V member 6 n=1 Tax=Ditylenchus destructor TaxID=166010 RepID=A0AAD4MYJ1_9BILA|nr:transient receptor potential cation channel subfamily V member 6 [Ditylenchus destructor]
MEETSFIVDHPENGRRNSHSQRPSTSRTNEEKIIATPLYQMVDKYRGGDLINIMKDCQKYADFSRADWYIQNVVINSMYNEGKGRVESIAVLVQRRNKERNDRLAAFKRKKGKGNSGSNILAEFDPLKLLDGGKGDAKFREIVWRLEERGVAGENLVGCCLLQGSPLHKKLSIHVLETYPKLVNDIFVSEDYYGLSPLHQAILNADIWLTSYLLQKGADVNQRCYGAIFCAEDQRESREDSLEHEYVEMDRCTNYTGRMYYGEYPLSFAACTDQFDCYRLLLEKRANPNAKDTNGNTVLHMTVIHEKMEMLKLAYDTGGNLAVANNLNLTPLTLAAKLAKKNVFQQILQLESTLLWNYGKISSISYPLANIDTINEETGNLNDDSALSLVVYGGSEEHLDLLDLGLLEELLEAKWKYFARRRWMQSLFAFSVYYVIFCMAFMSRPFSMTTSVLTGVNMNNFTELFNHVISDELSSAFDEVTESNSDYSYKHEVCHLWNYTSFGASGHIRMVCELLTFCLVLVQLISEIVDVYNVGIMKWWRVLKSFPAKLLYKSSFLLIILILPVRLLCKLGNRMLLLDNMFSLISVLLTTSHFLFYCRAIKFFGPFVSMIYTIIARDFLRFSVIYFVFIFGFSQGFYVVLLSCQRVREQRADQRPSNITWQEEEIASVEKFLRYPHEGILHLVMLTVPSPESMIKFYNLLDTCPSRGLSVVGKFMFTAFELLVRVMQLSVLIAMMTRTYKQIAETQKEWKRQWAQVILMLELSVSRKQRLIALLQYSRPIGTDKTRRAFVVTRKIETVETEMEKLIREQQAIEKAKERRMILKRRLKDRLTKYHVPDDFTWDS